MSAEVIQIETTPTGPEAPVVETRPENVPEKFWDAEKQNVNTEALLKSYSELERKVGGNQAPEEAPEAPEGTPETPQPETPEDNALAVAQEAGIDVDELQQHYMENGSISEDHYAKLEKRGIPKDVVDEFINYRVAQVENMRQEVFSSVGGEREFASMTEWAAKHWNEKQVQAFNAVMDSGSPEQWRLAASSLKADYERANGVRPKLVTPTTTTTTGGERFESMRQLIEAQKDPRYEDDEAYRNKVISKLQNSNF